MKKLFVVVLLMANYPVLATSFEPIYTDDGVVNTYTIGRIKYVK